MKYYNASFDIVIWRFYLMMAVAGISFYSGFPILALLCLPIFLSAMLGITFEFNTANTNSKKKSSTTKNILVYPDRNVAA